MNRRHLVTFYAALSLAACKGEFGTLPCSSDDQCLQGSICTGGQCVAGPSCSAGQTLCHSCTDLASDVNNCGACGTVCTPPAGASPVCSANACDFSCPAGTKKLAASCLAKPAAPTSLVATAGANGISLAWRAQSDATGYVVLRGTAAGQEAALAGATPTAAAYLDTSGLSPGTTYYYVVQATNAAGVGPSSAEASATTPPPAVTGLTATGGSKQVTLSWTAAAGATSYAIGRSVTQGGPYGPASGTSSATSAGFVDNGLIDGQTYYYVVTPALGALTGAQSAEVSAITQPPAPANLVAAFAGNGQISLNWSRAQGAATYTVLRGTTSGQESVVLPAVTDPAAAALDSGLTNGTRYYYNVHATNAAGDGPSSNEASAVTTLPAPTGVSAVATNLQIQLSWTAVAGASGYTIQRGTTSGTYPVTFNSTSAGALDANGGPGLAPGTTYYYVVSAVTPTVTSAPSAEVSAVTAPPAPANVVATATDDTHVSLSWPRAAGAARYLVLRGTGSGAESATPIATVNDPAAIATDAGLTPGTKYFYVVRAQNAAGTSVVSPEATATTTLRAPAGLVAAATGVSVALSWSGVAGAAGYTVLRGTQSGGPYGVTIGTTPGTSLGDPNGGPALPRGTAYYYVVEATTPVATSAPSQEASTVTAPAAPASPGAAPGADDVTATFTWNRAPGALSYLVKRGTFDGGEVPLTTVADPGSGATAALNDTGLNPGSKYFYQVLSANDAGFSPTASAEAMVVTRLLAPAFPAAVALDDSHINFSFNRVNGATQYQIYRVKTSGTENFGGSPIATFADDGGSPVVFNDLGLNTSTTYYYQAVAVNGTPARSAPSVEVFDSTRLFAPNGLSAVTVDASKLQVSWSRVFGALSYNVYRGLTPGGEGASAITNVSDTGSATAGFTDLGLASGTTYYYQVSAINAATQSGKSVEASGVTIPATPAAPGAAATSDRQIVFSWTRSPGAVAYDVLSGPQSGGESYRATIVDPANALTDSVAGGTQYWYQVLARNDGGPGGGGASAFTTEVTAITPPSAPADSGVGVVDDTHLTLFWTPSHGALAYDVFRGDGGAPGNEVYLTTVADTGGALSYADQSLVGGTLYSYEVRGVGDGGAGPLSSEKTATTVPTSPAPVLLATDDRHVSVSWSAVTGAFAYDLFRGNATGTEALLVSIPGDAGPAYVYGDTVAGGSQYWYQLRADGVSGGARSSEATVTTPPSAPLDGGIAVVSSAAIDVSWTRSHGALAYDVWRGDAGAAGNEQFLASVADPGSGQGVVFHDTALSGSTRYNYEVFARGDGGTGPATAELVALTTPAAPTGLVVSVVDPTHLNLSWTPPAGVQSYTVLRGTASGSESSIGSQLADAGAVFHDTVASGTQYEYELQAINATGPGPLSGEATGTTPPAAPIPVGAAADGGLEVDVSWALAHGARTYDVYRGDGGNDRFLATVNDPTALYRDFAVTPGLRYSYSLVARGDGGASPASLEAFATTGLGAPIPLIATAISPVENDLLWNAVTGATGYLLQRSVDGGFYSQLADAGAAALSYKDLTAAPSQPYWYRVAGFTSATQGPPATAQVTTQALGVPGSFAIQAVDTTRADLSWNPVPFATGYNVILSYDGGYYFTHSTTPDAGILDTGLPPGTNLFYAVQATANDGGGALSPVATAQTLLERPASVTATITAVDTSLASLNTVQLSWTPVPGALGYQIYTGANGFANQFFVNQTPDAGYIDIQDGGLDLYYHVSAYTNDNGGGNWTLARLQTSLPPPALNLTVSGQAVQVSWTPTTSLVAGYRVRRYDLTGDGGYVTPPVYGSSAIDLGNPPGAQVRYALDSWIWNDAGVGPAPPAPPAFTVPSGGPGQPTNLTASSSQNAVNLSWTAAPGAVAYQVYFSADDGGTWSAQYGFGSASPGLNYTHNISMPSALLTYRVQGNNGGDAGALSAPLQVVQASVPAAPAIQAAAGAATDGGPAAQVSLRWSPVTGALAYLVSRSLDNVTFTPIDGGVLQVPTTCTDITPAANTTYYYEVTATNDAGFSPPSASVQVVTSPAGFSGYGVTYFVTEDGGEYPVPNNYSATTLNAIGYNPDGGTGFVTTAAVGSGDGRFTIPPIATDGGFFWLRNSATSRQFTWTNVHSGDLSVYLVGRPNVVPITIEPTWLNFNLTGMAPWGGSGDIIQMFSPNAQMYSYFSGALGNVTPLRTDRTYTQDQIFDEDSYPNGLIDSTQGDAPVLYHQLTQTSSTGVPYAGAVEAVTLNLKQADGVESTVSGAWTPIPQTNSFNFGTLARSAFAPAVTVAGPAVVRTPDLLVIDTLPNVVHGAFSQTGFPDLVTVEPDSANYDLDAGLVVYGNPYPPAWSSFPSVAFNYNNNYQLPGTTGSLAFYGSVSYRDSIAGYNAAASGAIGLQPGILPVQSVQLSGQNALNGIDGGVLGTTPTLTWTPPARCVGCAGGVPEEYIVRILEVVVPGGAPPFPAFRLRLRVRGTSAPIPPGVLFSGKYYFAVITAYHEPGLAAQYVFQPTFPLTAWTSDAFTNWFSP